ncbi:glycosyltransferase family 4 protein [Sphingobacterium sp. UDSM-2020]|uniref:glycosyltransferase family 4 protein n=1 Tax=Sphingobacterium sp. UDSM-2020 TaxID=2795738 RepID=UPI001937FD4C|nr:glycosyltransferase family 4 protein [Sphingobacterium sp. UDSM-2020]QQD15385.1 glycosyltransferase family 4 protein [Sphingobacterium sp. UDSM-2020]
MTKEKLIRITTVPISLKVLLKGQHRFMKSKGFDVLGVSSAGKELEEVHVEEGVPVEALQMTRTIAPLQDLKALWAFYRLCRREKPVIVHSHTPKAGIVGMLGARLAGVPIRLHTVAGMPLMEATGLKRKVLDWVEKLTYAAATGVYPNSKGLYDFIVQHHYTANEKLKVIGNGSSNGIDTSFFSREKLEEADLIQLRTFLNIKENDFVFVFVGRLVGDKGINELVSAFVQLNQANVKLLLVGPLESDLDPLAPEVQREIDTNPNIIAAGFQKDVRPYFAISNVLVFPSYREGFPNVVMQAGALELPSIVSNINGCNEIIIEGQNGTIIPVKDSEAIQIAMARFVGDVEFYNQLKVNARKMITERYEQKVVWDALLAEYKHVLKNV